MADTLNSFADITERLDEIVASVRAKDTSLERSLDLLDEGIALGSRAVELVDSFDLSPEEAEQLAEAVEADAAEGEGAACGTTAGAPEAGPAPEDTE
ncbi:exodeoxyribonuclease VII small subunit [Enorma burkinafasonensis]|uniref:exodeoxyribonuclease VII small subunit n=1 Tax=Enorma burkinafasonensis TaxID=2590867 RepID=UPI0026F260D3|nr:exodeoxyribonuclease VII small subunit [Enorma burkinafasonensis]MCI7730531.1 exodeoxyribonuclease VII small subunit [Enorma burkinafasonensis]